MTKVLVIIGTRPEAIKMAPVIAALRRDSRFGTVVCSTGQHREMLRQVLSVFGVSVDQELDLMRPDQTLPGLTAQAIQGLDGVVQGLIPDWLLVQGDTTTAFCGALAGFYAKVRVAHVEAGLRTGNITSPWPEEMNRRLISVTADLHFAPTERAAENLRREGHDDDTIQVTGNTVVDALKHASAMLASGEVNAQVPYTLRPDKRLVLVTGHRRENFTTGLGNMCEALRSLAGRGDLDIVYPVHLNPNVQTIVNTRLQGVEDVQLIPPLDYLQFVQAMMDCHLIITDSGGVQEEAPALGKPVLVTRDTTERQEAVEAGTARLVGRNLDPLLEWANRLLDEPAAYEQMARAANPFGDGRAAQRIVDRLANA